MTSSPVASGARPASIRRRNGSVAAGLVAALAAALAGEQAPRHAGGDAVARHGAGGRKAGGGGHGRRVRPLRDHGDLGAGHRGAAPRPHGGARARPAWPARTAASTPSSTAASTSSSRGRTKRQRRREARGDPFAELYAPQPPLLVELKPVDATLRDFQQRSYWLNVDERRLVRRGGRAQPRRPAALARRHLAPRRRAGARGGGAEEGQADAGVPPLDAARGRAVPGDRVRRPRPALGRRRERAPAVRAVRHPEASRGGRRRVTVGPFGFDRFLAPADTTYFRIELPEARPAQLQVGQADSARPFDNTGFQAEITKNSVPPAAELELGKTPGHDRIVTVTAEAGQPYILQQFEDSHDVPVRTSGDYWVSTVHSGHAADSVDATVMVARPTRSGWTADVPRHRGRDRRETRLGAALQPPRHAHGLSQGRHDRAVRGPHARRRGHVPLRAVLHSRPRGYETPKPRPPGSTWDLDAGFYVLTVEPETKGIVDVVVRPYGVVTQAPSSWARCRRGADPLRAAALFPSVALDSTTTTWPTSTSSPACTPASCSVRCRSTSPSRSPSPSAPATRSRLRSRHPSAGRCGRATRPAT